MRNVVMAAMLVAAGVSSSYVTRTGGSDSAGEAASKGKTPMIEENLPQPIDDPLDLLKNFLDPTYPPLASTTGSCEDPIDRRRDLINSSRTPCVPQETTSGKEEADGANCAVRREFKDWPLTLNFIIATIPDPEKTHLGLSFDRALEAIINAAEDGGFGYDRYWLPWHVNHDQRNLDPRKQDILDGRAEARHRKPGVIILRRRLTVSNSRDPATARRESEFSLQEGENAALVVFLVGETPTDGINRRQFKKAADYIRSFAGGDKPCGYALGILGPTFSGSYTSLRAALQTDFPVQPQGSLIVSGSASDLDRRAGVGLATVHSDAFLTNALESLRSTMRYSGEAAFLKEAATDFGMTPFNPIQNPASMIYYPREISRLRNVYPEQTNSAAAQVANLQQQLSLRLRDSRSGEDTLPEFSDQTPLTQETILLQISETLRRDHIGLAVITGTDVLDVLFLSRHLRELSPDVRLLIWDSDLLFVHGTDTLDFSGMLAISTYPLIPSNHSWTDRPLPRSFFASNITEGIYNACLALLSDPKHPLALREYSAPTIWAKQPSGDEGPPAWLSVIGHDAYWPLGFVSDPNTDREMYRAPAAGGSSLDPGRPTRAWSSIFYFCSLLAYIYVGIYFYVLRQNLQSLPRWCSFLHPRPIDALPWRAEYSFVLTLSLMLAYLCFLVPGLRLVFANYHLEWVAMLVVGIFGFVGFLVALARGLMLSGCRIGATVAVLGFLGAIYLVNFRTGNFLDEESFFRALRSVQIGSGVGPDLPLLFLFLALARWASIQIQRARMVVEQRPKVPSIAANDAAANIRLLDGWLGQNFLYLDGSGWIVAGVGTLVTGVVAIPHIISVDGLLIDAAVGALVVPLSTLLFLTAYAFARIWRALNRLLEALETQPIRFAFSNLPSDLSWSHLWQYSARKRTYTTLVRSLESLRALKESEPEYYQGLSDDITKLDAHITAILTPVNQGLEEQITDIVSTQELLSGIAQHLSDAPRTKAWKTKHSESLDKLRKSCGSKIVHKGAANWFFWGKPAKLEVSSAPEDSEPVDKPEMLAAEIIALRYLAYIRYVIRHLRNLLSFITTGFILMTLALNCYPFQMLNLMRWSITIVFVLISVVLVYAFQEMSRNEILSRITDTKAGSLDAGFYTRAISVGVLPLLAVVASHFPSVGRFLFSWVQPAITALH